MTKAVNLDLHGKEKAEKINMKRFAKAMKAARNLEKDEDTKMTSS